MIPLGIIAASRRLAVGGVEWIGEALTVPAGASAISVAVGRANNDTLEGAIDGDPGTLIASERAGTGIAGRYIRVAWHEGPRAVTLDPLGQQDVSGVVLFVRGAVPGDSATASNNNTTSVTPLSPTIGAGGLVLSVMAHRSFTVPTPLHDYDDSGGDSYAGTESFAWTVGTDTPTDWTAIRYHAQVSVALDPK